MRKKIELEDIIGLVKTDELTNSVELKKEVYTDTENKRYSFNWERGHPNFWDNYCDLADCYLTCEDVVNRLNELHEENLKLKSENNMLRNTIGRNEAYIERLKHKGQWKTTSNETDVG